MSEPSGLRFLGGDRSYAFLRRLPWRSRAVLLTAVFFTFASMGFLQHMWKLEASPSWTRMGLVVAFNGLLAVGILFAVSVKRALIPVVVGFAIGFPALLGHWYPTPPASSVVDLVELQRRLLSEGIACMVFIVAGYALFIRFIRWEGAHQLRATTEIALAGHLPVLHWRAATATIQSIDNRCPPLGVVAGQRHASEHVEFAPGDLFVVLTDGLTEVNDRSQQEFGMTGIMQILERHAREPLPKLYSALLAAARAHGPQTDDQTLLLIRAR